MIGIFCFFGTLPVAEHILKNPNDRNNIDYWARTIKMSRRAFTMNFMEETGLSFVKWRHLVRIHAAIRLLGEGRRIKEISHKVGFSTPALFIKTFQAFTGTSPGRYKKIPRRLREG